MRWQGGEESRNVENRQGGGFGGGRMGGGGMGLPIHGVSGFLMIMAVMVAGYYGIDLTPLIGGGQAVMVDSGGSSVSSAQQQELSHFSSIILKTTEDTWGAIFQQMGRTYQPPKLVLYSGGTSTGCGYGQTAMGPFYCPEDQTVYLDVAFYQELKDRLGGGGDFAQGYVLAHEVGHHVQHLLGIEQQVTAYQQRSSKTEANHLSVRLELQADCYAGVWGRAMNQEGILDPGDLEEALNTAEAIGDDHLQSQAYGRVMPDSFTHGTSQQRYFWFKRGFDTGDPCQCDTFSDTQ